MDQAISIYGNRMLIFFNQFQEDYRQYDAFLYKTQKQIIYYLDIDKTIFILKARE